MIYSTGTISINGNTATGSGTNWTAPASQVRAGQTIIVMSNPVQLFQISSVNSATSMTVTPAASPALSGQKYGILVSDIISVDGLAQAMSQLINEYDENIGAWETFASTSANQLVTVTINGTSLSIPAIGGLARKGANSDITELKGLSTALSIDQGGTGAKTKEAARTNLGLGSSATRDAYSTSGSMLAVGDFGVGSYVMNRIHQDARVGAGFYRALMLLGGIGNNVSLIEVPYDANTMYQLIIPTIIATKPKLYLRTLSSDATYNGQLVEFYSTGNTTKASDGTLKAASPVVRIVKSQEDNRRTDIDEDGFTWSGAGTVNHEAKGVTITRLDTGIYLLSGSAGLASEGWQLLPPMDPGGMGELGIVEAEQTESGGLTICLFKRKYMLGDDGEIIKTKGEPMDVPANSWIDVRLEMPENSVWNQRQKAAVDAAENESGS